jgi:hypothetical protein
LAVLADAKFLETSIKQFIREDVFFCSIFTAHVYILSLMSDGGTTGRTMRLSILSEIFIANPLLFFAARW